MTITTQEIRVAIERILAEYDALGAHEWSFDDDFYWDVLTDDRYRPYTEPPHLGIGQISDDLSKVRSISSGETDPVPLALVWVASVLRLAGERGPFALKSPGVDT